MEVLGPAGPAELADVASTATMIMHLRLDSVIGERLAGLFACSRQAQLHCTVCRRHFAFLANQSCISFSCVGWIWTVSSALAVVKAKLLLAEGSHGCMGKGGGGEEVAGDAHQSFIPAENPLIGGTTVVQEVHQSQVM